MKKYALASLLGLLLAGTAATAAETNQNVSSDKDKYQKTTESLKKLTPEQYNVTQKGMTEKPFANEYWNHFEEGIYVDVVTGEPLFSSLDKYDAGNGWPAFHKPIREDFIDEAQDNSHGMQRTEIKSSSGSSHLGHVFDEGKGERHYCVNSSSLRFVPKDKLIEEGYAEYVTLFLGK